MVTLEKDLSRMDDDGGMHPDVASQQQQSQVSREHRLRPATSVVRISQEVSREPVDPRAIDRWNSEGGAQPDVTGPRLAGLSTRRRPVVLPNPAQRPR